MTGRSAIVLAAGAGRRFGGAKMLTEWRGRPLVAWAVQAALGARVDEVIVVLGSQAQSVQDRLESEFGARVTVVHAPDWAEGQSASLRAGVASLASGADRFAVFLGDMPLTPSGLADRLLDAVSAQRPAARPVTPDGPGHPVAFHRTLSDGLLQLSGDSGAATVLRALGDGLITIPTDDAGTTFDIDRPEDLASG